MLVWDLANVYREFSSPSFQIVEHLAHTKPGPEIEVEPVGAMGGTFHLPGFATLEKGHSFSGAMVLPYPPMFTDTIVTFALNGCAGKELRFESIELFAVDASSDCSVFLKDYKLHVSRNGREYTINDPAETPGILDVIEIARSQGTPPYRDITLGEADNMLLHFEFAPKRESATRLYLLKYDGQALNAEDSDQSEMPTALFLSNPHPNPFNPSTTVEFHVPVRGFVSLDIYDAAGNHIRNLWSAPAECGVHKIAWDGRNKSGKAASSGVYFCTLTADNSKSLTRKMVLLK